MDISADGLKAVCPYCGSRYSYVKPVTEDTATYINRANNYRMRNMFDNAIVEYKTLLMNAELKDNAELYWGLTLSEFGIEYIHDTRDDRYVPTCHRTVSGSIFDNANYKKAIELATDEMKAEYASKASEIDELQRGIKAQAEQVEDYDVFICFKSTDNRVATEDRYIARRIFDETTKRGFRTFFSEVSLKGRLGSEYEPIIYKALTTAKVMILVATKEEYLNAPFVRNEWSRYIERRKNDPSLKIVPVFRDIDANVLPTREQGVDLSKYPAGGYEIEIADNLEKVLGKQTVAKMDKEVLEEYSRYNAISQIKFEKEYKNAMRDVDVGLKRKKDAGREYADKAAAMESLGDYKNAEALATKYSELAEFYTKAEKKVTFRMRLINMISVGISLITAIYGITMMAFLSSFGCNLPIPRMFMFSCIITGLSLGIVFFVSVIYAAVINRLCYSKGFSVTEILSYAVSVLMMAAVTVIYSVTASASAIFQIIILLVYVAILIINFLKYVFVRRLPDYETIK